MDSRSRSTSSEAAAVDDVTELNVSAVQRSDIDTQRDETPPAPPPRHSSEDELAAGTLLGEYRIEAKIAEGGMGVVYAAIHPKIGKRAAVKLLRRELCADASQVRRFLDEARVVAEIDHPNIINIFTFGEMPDGRCYFVMEWLKGRTLRARLDAGTLTLAEVCAVVRPLCRALEAAHDKQIIHRDLKPDNVFLVDVRGEYPQIKLLDFGIAKLQHSDRQIDKTATGTMIGTPQYIAPEQARGYAIDHTVDTYALGGILFEMLTGRPPFLADNAMDIVAKHLLEIPQRMSTLRPDAPPELDDLVARMLEKEPAQRPSLARVLATLDEVATRLLLPAGRDSSPASMSWPGGVVARATPVPIPVSADPQPARSRTTILRSAVAAIGVVVAAVAAFAIVMRFRTPIAAPTAAIAPAIPAPAPSPATVAPPASSASLPPDTSPPAHAGSAAPPLSTTISTISTPQPKPRASSQPHNRVRTVPRPPLPDKRPPVSTAATPTTAPDPTIDLSAVGDAIVTPTNQPAKPPPH